MADAAVTLRHVFKRFAATQALVDVDIDIDQGEVHGLVGQNGAGKSTLGKVISGIHQRDSGEFLAFGAPVRHWSPRLALATGIAMIQQELSLVPELTVAQNVYLGIEDRRYGFLAGREVVRFEELNARVGFRLSPSARVGSLRFADRQKVEILRALARDARLIVMDEPSSALSIDETRHLHEIIERLSDDGRSIVYVSHYLDEVLRVCDRVTTMRDGRIVRTAAAAEETEESLVTAMLGRSLAIAFPDRQATSTVDPQPVLHVEHLRSEPSVIDVSFDVYPGEIVGLAGLVGSGRSETLRTIFGVDPGSDGIVVEGRPYVDRSALESLTRGIGMIPEDRRSQGLVSTMSVRENVTLPSLPRFARWGLLNEHAEVAAVATLLEDLAVVPQRGDEDITKLSGGNQQKVLFGKWLGARPRLLLLDEPTKGIDVAAKTQIYDMIASLASQGMSIVLVSSELEEVMGLSHRVYLIRDGQTIGEVDPHDATLDDVLFRLFGLAEAKAG